jgi:uncharacterized membrane protein YdfJ with MMPL/SSD domain
VQRFMLRLDRGVRRRRLLVVVAWVAVLAAAVPFAMRQSDHLTGGGFNVPGSQSDKVRHALARDFPGGDRGQLAALLVPAPGASAADLRDAVARVQRAADRAAHVTLAPSARAAADRAAARGGTLIVPLAVDVGSDKSIDVAADLRPLLSVGTDRGGVTAHLVGQGALWAGLQDVTKHDLATAEQTGFPIVLLILLVVFGSLAAAALPLALGFFSVLITGALIFWLSRVMEMSVFVTNMASMIGIGVAVDYSLFVLARYREEIRAGLGREKARATALATSGLAVAFSGLTVIVSLGGLWMVDNAAMRSMALGAMLVVAVSVLAAATLLPALISLLGDRAHSPGRIFTVIGLVARSRRRRRPGSTSPGHAGPVGFWPRWTAAVTRRPAVTALGAAAVLLVLAIPVLSLKTGAGALRQFDPGNETRVGAEAAARVLGPGASAPTQVLATFKHGTARDGANARALASLRTSLRRDPEVAAVAAPLLSRDGRAAMVSVTPRSDGESAAAKAMVGRLRASLPGSPEGARATIRVGGTTALQRDFRNLVAGSMWKLLVFVLALSYLVLLVLLRSAILPLKAVVMNLLSVGASYGVLVATFQWGWLSWLGLEKTGSLDTLTPPLVLAVVFGLSMDYEVFLLSRIRERYAATGSTERAVAEGLAASARTITSAALIMVCVFAVFVGTGVPSIKELGLGNAVAIAVDATLVRLVLVPATMELLGKWNWWLPRPLARILPRAELEAAPARA